MALRKAAAYPLACSRALWTPPQPCGVQGENREGRGIDPASSALFRPLGFPSAGLRFFTVYGPWYRPDMALFVFADAISNGNPVKLFNGGQMLRDFTYIDDVTEALVRLIDRAPRGEPYRLGEGPDPKFSAAPWRIYNVGNNKPEELLRVVALLEQELGRKATRELLPMQPVTCR
jgi:UDP-glucuronate 4-epimerase